MIEEKEYSEKVIRVKIKKLKCDICEKNILKNLSDDDSVDVCTFTLANVSKQEIEEGNFNTSNFYQETSQFCKNCYNTLKQVAVKLGGKVPSQFFQLDKSRYEDLLERLEGDGCDA